jgi:hypothetical protein
LNEHCFVGDCSNDIITVFYNKENESEVRIFDARETLTLGPKVYNIFKDIRTPVYKMFCVIYNKIRVAMPICFTVTTSGLEELGMLNLLWSLKANKQIKQCIFDTNTILIDLSF